MQWMKKTNLGGWRGLALTPGCHTFTYSLPCLMRIFKEPRKALPKVGSLQNPVHGRGRGSNVNTTGPGKGGSRPQAEPVQFPKEVVRVKLGGRGPGPGRVLSYYWFAGKQEALCHQGLPDSDQILALGESGWNAVSSESLSL